MVFPWFSFPDPQETNNVCKKIWNPLGYGFAESRIQRENTTWYYDASTKTCMSFEALGCLGNANNFETKQICESTCASKEFYLHCALERCFYSSINSCLVLLCYPLLLVRKPPQLFQPMRSQTKTNHDLVAPFFAL